ncbi:MAG: hypothetical protein ACTHLZ_14555 [Tepidisphaeraceae bacterium]
MAPLTSKVLAVGVVAVVVAAALTAFDKWQMSQFASMSQAQLLQFEARVHGHGFWGQLRQFSILLGLAVGSVEGLA